MRAVAGSIKFRKKEEQGSTAAGTLSGNLVHGSNSSSSAVAPDNLSSEQVFTQGVSGRRTDSPAKKELDDVVHDAPNKSSARVPPIRIQSKAPAAASREVAPQSDEEVLTAGFSQLGLSKPSSKKHTVLPHHGLEHEDDDEPGTIEPKVYVGGTTEPDHSPQTVNETTKGPVAVAQGGHRLHVELRPEMGEDEFTALSTALDSARAALLDAEVELEAWPLVDALQTYTTCLQEFSDALVSLYISDRAVWENFSLTVTVFTATVQKSFTTWLHTFRFLTAAIDAISDIYCSAIRYKTVAVSGLIGNPTPSVLAVSGWNRNTPGNTFNLEVVDQQFAFLNAPKLASAIDHIFEADWRDGAQRDGAYYSSHCEPQLLIDSLYSYGLPSVFDEAVDVPAAQALPLDCALRRGLYIVVSQPNGGKDSYVCAECLVCCTKFHQRWGMELKVWSYTAGRDLKLELWLPSLLVEMPTIGNPVSSVSPR